MSFSPTESDDDLEYPVPTQQQENQRPTIQSPKGIKRKGTTATAKSAKRALQLHNDEVDASPNHQDDSEVEDNDDESSVSDWFTIQSETLKLSRNLDKGTNSDIELSNLRLSNFYRQVYRDRVDEIKATMKRKQWQFKRTVFVVSHMPGSQTYSIEDGAHRFMAITELNEEKDDAWVCCERVKCVVYEGLTDEARYALIPELTRADQHLPLRMVDDIELIRHYNDSHGMTAKRGPWKASEAIPFYDKLLGDKKQAENAIKIKARIACLPECDWLIIKPYLLAFQDNKIKFVPPRSHPEMNKQNGYRDLNNAEFWKRFQLQYDKNPSQTIAAFEKVDDRFRSYDELDDYIRNGISKFIGKLRTMGIEFNSIKEVCDEMLDGKLFSDQQLIDALNFRGKFQTVGRKSTSRDAIQKKLRWFFFEHSLNGMWQGNHVSEADIENSITSANLAIMDLKWVSDFAPLQSILRAAKQCDFVVLVSIDGNQTRRLWEHKANGLLVTPTLRMNLVLKTHAELKIGNVFQNTMEVWIYIRNHDILYKSAEIEEVIKSHSLSTTMKPKEFGPILKTLMSWKFVDLIPRMFVIPPLAGLEDFSEMFKTCLFPADFVYINNDHRDRMLRYR